MIVKQLTDEDQLHELYRMRYKIFIEGNKDAETFYSDGLFKDDDDVYGLHFACYEGTTMLGGVSALMKDMAPNGYLPIEKQPGNLVCEKESAEFKELFIFDEYVGNDVFKRGKILNGLLSALARVSKVHNIQYVYLETLEIRRKLYEGFGSYQIGEPRPYKRFFETIPMKVSVENINVTILNSLATL